MSESLENRWEGLARNGNALVVNSLNNLTIKQIQFSNQNEQQIARPKALKTALPTKIYHHGYYKIQNKNKKMLPDLVNKPVSQTKIGIEDKNFGFKERNFGRSIKNARNSEILNSLIEILKNDPDSSDSKLTRNGRTKTEPSFLNQFLESRQISSVKNSRGPKIIGNEIMMLGNKKQFKRNLVSEQKSRSRNLGDQGMFLSKPPLTKKADPFDQMQMTFYKPSKVLSNEHQNICLKKLEKNQFINIS